jgi:hypothetical protein
MHGSVLRNHNIVSLVTDLDDGDIGLLVLLLWREKHWVLLQKSITKIFSTAKNL